MHIPADAALGGAETMLPEYRKKIKDRYTVAGPLPSGLRRPGQIPAAEQLVKLIPRCNHGQRALHTWEGLYEKTIIVLTADDYCLCSMVAAEVPGGKVIVSLDPVARCDRRVRMRKLEMLRAHEFGISEGPVWVRDGKVRVSSVQRHQR